MRVVTATYNDEKHLYWIRNLRIPYTIYKKDDTLQVGDEIPDHISCPNIRMILPVKRIPNIGRCDYAFLYHIIQNYDNLDDVTIFVKCNWAQYSIDFGGLVNQCHAYDYMVKGTHPEIIDWDLAIDCPVDPDKLADNARVLREQGCNVAQHFSTTVEPLVGYITGPSQVDMDKPFYLDFWRAQAPLILERLPNRAPCTAELHCLQHVQT
jgi:hypothetical protein